MRERWTKWMAAENFTVTPGGNMRAPPLPTMAQWVLDSWHGVKDHVIVKSFKKCCILNAMDGSEDDILYAHIRRQGGGRIGKYLFISLVFNCFVSFKCLCIRLSAIYHNFIQ